MKEKYKDNGFFGKRIELTGKIPISPEYKWLEKHIKCVMRSIEVLYKKGEIMNESNGGIRIEPKIINVTIDYDLIKKRFKQEGLLISKVKDLFDKIELESIQTM